MYVRSRAMEFLKDTMGVETIEYAVATALLVAGVIIGIGGILLALLPLLASLAQSIFGI